MVADIVYLFIVVQVLMLLAGLFGISLFLFLTKTERASIFGYGERLMFGR